ncbi:hypothetical protein [Paractinoplanes hotanensis]|uniref:Rad50/SbcC-type AAA domain-containing protein n=1 Tax=Paractinoplanes hotanensis TaxID=2906497 RepID=A0ABT0Y8G2_9ACTN|nr:hypothetical protein [Actinoplanes hotanensis]MCM4082332.1 hypothetical protein [Actinoplanes hotanensis]
MTDQIPLTPTVEILDGADHWIGAVAKRARCTPDEARIELARQQIRPPAGWGPQRHLHLDALLFAGVKTPKGQPRTPYIFDIPFTHNVTAFGTHNENDAGKSTVIRTLRWALRGRSQLQNDVRKWMRVVVLQFSIEDERLVVAFAVNEGEPTGAVMRLRQPIDFSGLRQRLDEPIEALRDEPNPDAHNATNTVIAAVHGYLHEQHAVAVAEFDSSDDFERVMDDLMLERLGFPRVPSWQNRPSAQQAHDGDGTLGELGWQTWSSALSITEPSVPVVLGEEQHAVVRLLQMYLGSPWAITVAAIAARKGQLSSQLGILQRRLQDAKGTQSEDLAQLQAQLRTIDEELKTQPPPGDFTDLERRIEAAAQAGRKAAAAEAVYRQASLNYGEVSRLLESAEADVEALHEAKLTRRFWHSLKPSCCPRCDTDVSEDRWARERVGQCSLCDSPLDEVGEDPNTEPQQPLKVTDLDQLLSDGTDLDIDSLDDLTAAQLQMRQLEGQLAIVDRQRDGAREARDTAYQGWQAAQQAATTGPEKNLARWQQLWTTRAVTAARIEERQNTRSTSGLERDIEEVQRQQKIVKAAENEAKEHLRGDQEDLLRMVSNQVAILGKTLGVRNLESVTLVGNGHMPVVKGGEKANFGGLEPGEKLRLKIALIVALMRVGEEAGVARHPGLIVIDSLGREELNPKDMISMLAELVKLTREVPYLQVVLTSAYGERLVEGLGQERVLLAQKGQPLW